MKMKLVCLAIILGVSNASAHADSASDPQLHDPNHAKSSYESYSRGEGEDPFETLNKAYSQAYEQALLDTIRPQKEAATQEVANSWSEQSTTSIKVGSYQNDLSEVYQSSFNEDGEFDPVSYSEGLELLQEVYQIDISERKVSNTDDLINAVEEGVELQRLSVSSLNRNIRIAQSNLINEVSERNYLSKQEFRARLSAKLPSIESKLNSISTTTTIAAEFHGCDIACVFPEIFNEPTPINPTLNDEPEPPVVTSIEDEPQCNPVNVVDMRGDQYSQLKGVKVRWTECH